MSEHTSLTNKGVVVAVRGSVVDVRFYAGLPPIYNVLRTGVKNEIVIEVLAALAVPTIAVESPSARWPGAHPN